MSRAGSAHRRSLLLQKRIFRWLKSETERLMGGTPESIRLYEKEYRADFSRLGKRPKAVKKIDLIRAIRETDVTFISDFHTFSQAQRTAMRLMREAVLPGESWSVGLELIPSHRQPELDRFQAGRLSLEKFHKAINYSEEWGFSWENYAPVFDWARESGVRLVALNRPRELFRPVEDVKEIADLYERDRWAAGIITDLFAKRPNSRMIVLYGELHVGTHHLPTALSRVSKSYLKSPLRSVAVHQNHDDLYWRLAKDGRELHTEIIRLKKSAYCVLSSTPWAKLQSLLSWIEGETQKIHEEDGTDYLSLLSMYGETLAEFFGVKVPHYSGLTLREINEAQFVEEIGPASGYSPEELRLIRFHVFHNIRIYLSRPRLQVAYLGSPSENGTAEMAAIHLLRSRARVDHFFKRDEDDHFRLILESCFGFLGSLILNPRRKCDLPDDHSRRLLALKRGERAAYPFEREARMLALETLRTEKVSFRERTPPSARMMAARYVGQILAKRLHKAMLGERVSVESVRELFFERKLNRKHRDRYLTLLRQVGPSAVAPSKTESL